VIGVAIEPFSAFTAPSLTTADQHPDALSSALASLIVSGISDFRNPPLHDPSHHW